jgi:hypothetical protein
VDRPKEDEPSLEADASTDRAALTFAQRTFQVPGVRGPTYFRWVRRSLNRAGARLADLSTDDRDLRRAVKEFRARKGLPAGQGIDSKVQNALIKVNERDLLYVQWIQMALNIVFPTMGSKPRVPVTGVMDKKTRETIREFQRFENSHGVHGGTLEVDGVMGPKTEIRLGGYLEPPEPPIPI